jgi:uncharacterized surface protein with fasciclin (FAS1) repeats
VDTIKLVNAKFMSQGFVDSITFGPAVTTSVNTVELAIEQSPAMEDTLRSYNRFDKITGYLPADAAYQRLDVGMTPFLLGKSEQGIEVMDELTLFGFVRGEVLSENPDSNSVNTNLIVQCIPCDSDQHTNIDGEAGLLPADMARCESRTRDNFKFDFEGEIDDTTALCQTILNSPSIGGDGTTTRIQADCLGGTGVAPGGNPCYRDASNMRISGSYFKSCGDPNERPDDATGASNFLSCITDIRASNGALHIIDRALPFDPVGIGGVPGVLAPIETLTEIIASDENNDVLECAVSMLDQRPGNPDVLIAAPGTFEDSSGSTQSACGRVSLTLAGGEFIPKCFLDCRVNNIGTGDVAVGARTGCNEGPAAPCDSRESSFDAANGANLGSIGGAIGTCDNGYTIFAPKDEKWLDLPAGIREFLLVSQFPDAYDNLRTIFLNHISEFSASIDENILYASDIVDYLALNETTRPDIISAANEVWNITQNGDGVVSVNGVPVVAVDVPAMNGVKHEVDGLIFPDQLKDRDALSYTMPKRDLLEVVQSSPFYTWNSNFQDDELDLQLNCTTSFPEVVETGTCDFAWTFFQPTINAVDELQGSNMQTTNALRYIQGHPAVAKKIIQAHVMDTQVHRSQMCLESAGAESNCLTPDTSRCLFGDSDPNTLSYDTLYEKSDGEKATISLDLSATGTVTVKGETPALWRDPVRNLGANDQTWAAGGSPWTPAQVFLVPSSLPPFFPSFLPSFNICLASFFRICLPSPPFLPICLPSSLPSFLHTATRRLHPCTQWVGKHGGHSHHPT